MSSALLVHFRLEERFTRGATVAQPDKFLFKYHMLEDCRALGGRRHDWRRGLGLHHHDWSMGSIDHDDD